MRTVGIACAAVRKVAYYIYHPKGSTKLSAANDTEALSEFYTHWTLSYDIVAGKQGRRLIRETREDITPT